MSTDALLVVATTSLLASAVLAACGGGTHIASCAPVTAAEGDRMFRVDDGLGAMRCHFDPATLRTSIRLAADGPIALELGGWPAPRAADGSFELDLLPALLASPAAGLTSHASAIELELPLVVRAGDAAPVTSRARFSVDTRYVNDYFAGATRGIALATTGSSAATLLFDDVGDVITGTAATLGDIRYVATLTSQIDRTQTCGPYTLPEGRMFHVRLEINSSEVVVYDTRRGAEVERHRFEPAYDEPCPYQVIAPAELYQESSEGAYPDPALIRQWLTESANVRPR